MHEASATELLAELAAPGDQETMRRFTGPLRDLAREGFLGEGALLEVDPSTRARIMAAFELARRRQREDLATDRKVADALDVVAFADPWMRDETVEVFRVVLLDARHHVLAFPEISRGTLNASLVHPREVFRPAVIAAAASVIVVHNHPSGDPTPSAEDEAVTRRLARAGEILGIPVVDHVVMGEARHASFREFAPAALCAKGGAS